MRLIQECRPDDFKFMLDLINQAAQVYKGKIPADRWAEPYMPVEELEHEIASGVRFYGFEENGRILGVMGIQEVGEVTLIRHAYVLPGRQNQGIGGKLIEHLKSLTRTPHILVGTWAAATWAISFYEKHGFRLLSAEESRRLLKKYWSIPQRQIETSVVLVYDP
ncbi:MAG: GNAT family N-acetyltransferase [Actinomycetota bacterium]